MLSWGRGAARARERLQLGWEGAMALQRAQPVQRDWRWLHRARHGALHTWLGVGFLGKGAFPR